MNILVLNPINAMFMILMLSTPSTPELLFGNDSNNPNVFLTKAYFVANVLTAYTMMSFSYNPQIVKSYVLHAIQESLEYKYNRSHHCFSITALLSQTV